MKLTHVVAIAAALFLSGSVCAQESTAPRDRAASEGAALGWLGPVECDVNTRGTRVSCVDANGLEVSTCTSRGNLFLKARRTDEDFDLVAHSCQEQGAEQVCVIANEKSWTCGRRDGEAYAVAAPARRCHFFANRKLFDCRIYDLATGAKAHLIRCNIGRLAAGRKLQCRPVESSQATWL